MWVRDFAEGPSATTELDREWPAPCLRDNFLPSPVAAAGDPLVDLPLAPVRVTKDCTGRSSRPVGPVDRIKSAKSRIDSARMRGSLASGLSPPDDLMEGDRLAVGVGPLPREAVRAGIGGETTWFPLPVLLGGCTVTGGYTVTEEVGVCFFGGSFVRTTDGSCYPLATTTHS
jgi:hypothetical protein